LESISKQKQKQKVTREKECDLCVLVGLNLKGKRKKGEIKISIIQPTNVVITGRGLREEQGAGGEALEFFAVRHQ